MKGTLKNKNCRVDDKWNFDDFYDAFHNCAITKNAILSGNISTDQKYLPKYFAVEKQKNQDASISSHTLPQPYDKLVKLQKVNGKWEDLTSILNCVHLPPDTLIEGANSWETATALVLASFRQKYDLFDKLFESYEKGCKILSNPIFIQAAIEILNIHSRDISEYTNDIDQPHNVEKDLSLNLNDTTISSSMNQPRNSTLDFIENKRGNSMETEHTDEITIEPEYKHTINDFYTPVDEGALIQTQLNIERLQVNFYHK